MPPVIAAIIGLVSNIVGGLTQTQKEKIALELQANQALMDMMAAQSAINEKEASSESVFVAGWRPFIGWVCGISFAWQYVGLPILLFLESSFGHTITVPAFDFGTMSTVLMGMLGLGALRSYDKYQSSKNK